MARTAQTAGLSRRDIYHTQAFTDHAGQSATRVRRSSPDEPIPTDFHAKPVFVFQVYITIPLDLEERSAKRSRIASSSSAAEPTLLTDLVDYIGLSVADGAQRPQPIWEIYAEQQGIFECVEHQRREIAYRKARREDPSIPPIPKVLPSVYTRDKTGFVIVIDSDNFMAGLIPPASEGGDQGPLWVSMDRKFPSQISWEPRLRLEADPETMASGIFGPPEVPTVLPQRVDATFQRIQRLNEMHSNMGMMYFSSCTPSDPPSSVQGTMDVCWDEDEGAPDDEGATYTEDAITTLRNLAARLSLDDFNVSRLNTTDIIITNVDGSSEPDLRYVIYVPFLHLPGMGDTLEQAANAFTHEVTSRFSEKKTVSFEFCKPPSKSLSSILKAQREKDEPEDYIGALTTFPNDEGSTRIRAHPIALTEHANENDPARVGFEPYRTFIVVLERPDFSQVEGSVLFLLADGGKHKPSADSELPQSMKPEFHDYVEMQLWRCAGMDEVARRLQMVWGGVRWEQGAEEES